MSQYIEKSHVNQQVTEIPDPNQQKSFLAQVRTGPGFLGFKPLEGGFFEKHFADDAEALALIDLHGGQADTWVSMASYSNPGESRSQNNAEGLCALWLDVDAHVGSKYKSVSDVQEALDRFVRETGLPPPSLLHLTGYGIHAVWTFTQVIPRNEWQPVADKLQDLGQRLALGADPITADAARILRVPGTKNFREPVAPRLAELHETGVGCQDFDAVAAAIDRALVKFPAEVKMRGKHATKKFDSPEVKTNVDLVAAMLAAIDPDIDYCVWRDVMWSVAATGWGCSYELVRAWCTRGSKWDEDTFNRVWDSFDEARGIGFGTLVHHTREFGYTGLLPSKTVAKQIKPSGGLVTVCAADIEPEHVEWLVDQSFPLGMLAVIGGQPGLGKSQISISLAAGVTTGKGLPGTAGFKNLGSVIILANEDDAARTIRPRLDAAGADISKVHIVQGVAREGADVDIFQLDSDISDLRDRALQIGDVRLIIIDPPSAYLGTKVDSYKDSDVRRVLMPLGKLAQETGAMILLIVHLNKRTDGGAQQRFSGSTAWTAAPRVGFMVAEDPLTKQRFMLPVKNNIGDDRLGYQYHIAEKLIQYGGHTFKSSYIVWDQTTNRSVAELIAPPKANRRTVVDDAKEFLEDELAKGPLPVEQIKASAKAAGISWPSVNRAKKAMPISSTKVGEGWSWTLFISKESGNV
ncbi:MAG: AAA family ATPase [Betaproteobacteria bacterium]